MGDRALFQVTDGKDVGPVVYGHWSGAYAREIVDTLAERMAGRTGDYMYATARLCGIMHERVPGNLSLGMWNQTSKLTADDSHGDAGCFVIDCRDWSVETLGGYGFES